MVDNYNKRNSMRIITLHLKTNKQTDKKLKKNNPNRTSIHSEISFKSVKDVPKCTISCTAGSNYFFFFLIYRQRISHVQMFIRCDVGGLNKR